MSNQRVQRVNFFFRWFIRIIAAILGIFGISSTIMYLAETKHLPLFAAAIGILAGAGTIAGVITFIEKDNV